MARHCSGTSARRRREDAHDHEVPPVAGQQQGLPALPGHRPPGWRRGASSCCAAMTIVARTGLASGTWASTSAPSPGGTRLRAWPGASLRLGSVSAGRFWSAAIVKAEYAMLPTKLLIDLLQVEYQQMVPLVLDVPAKEVHPRPPQRRIGPGGQLRPGPARRSRRAVPCGGGRAAAHGAADHRRLRSRRGGQRAGEKQD